MANKLHIAYATQTQGTGNVYEHSKCHYKAHGVLCMFDKFDKIAAIADEICCKECLKIRDNYLRSPNLVERYNRDMGMLLLALQGEK